MEFKTGQIVFFRSNGLYGKIVSLYNRINYDVPGFGHVGIITEVTEDKVLIHEAISKGFIAGYYSKEYIQEKIDNDKITIGETKEELSYVLEHANNYLGRPYGWMDIVSISLAFFTGFRFLGITGAKKLICSEAVARILYDASDKKINFESEYDKSFDTVTPMDIYLSNQVNTLSRRSLLRTA